MMEGKYVYIEGGTKTKGMLDVLVSMLFKLVIQWRVYNTKQHIQVRVSDNEH